MSVKISDLAKKLGLEIKALRSQIKDMHLGVSERANVFRDELAMEIERRIKKDEVKSNSGKENVLLKKKVEKDMSEGVQVVSSEENETDFGEEMQSEVLDVLETKNDESENESDLPRKPQVEIPPLVTVGEFAARMNIGVSDVIKELMKNGILANINEHIDFDTATIIGEDLGFEVTLCQNNGNDLESCLVDENRYDKKYFQTRPPIITVMGHVDHGKTSILDRIRKADVVAKESGGITQHMGAYQVKKNGRTITFLDTPGHKAFSAMRAHGAKLTDIAVLVVAADDGVKPQTIEAINHARAAGVPIIVAINKIDKPEANIDKVKRELADFNLLPEEWGGNTIMVLTSAKSGEGIDELLEMILLVADVEDLKAYREGPAQALVIEAHLSKRVGPVATVMVTQGCLHVRDSIIVGTVDGVVRAMVDQYGERISKAYPADPVRIAGLHDVPEFGDTLYVVNNLKEAKNIVLSRRKSMMTKGFTPKTVGMAELSQAVREGKINVLPVILKTDVQGSLEAIRSSLQNLHNDEVKVEILHEAAGLVNESDIMMAASSNALILSFRANIEPSALKLAKKMGIKISSYDVIYRLLDDVTAALEGLLKPEIVKVKVGKGKVLRVFTHGKKFRVIGVGVTSGLAEKGLEVIVFRDGKKVGEGKIDGLKKGTESVDKVAEKNECGLGLAGDIKVEEGDSLEFWKSESRVRRLSELE